jgi:hypothetical protein
MWKSLSEAEPDEADVERTAALALVAAPLSAAAESLFRWTAEDSSAAFTDDAKRIPERYRAAARDDRDRRHHRRSTTRPPGRGANGVRRRLAARASSGSAG